MVTIELIWPKLASFPKDEPRKVWIYCNNFLGVAPKYEPGRSNLSELALLTLFSNMTQEEFDFSEPALLTQLPNISLDRSKFSGPESWKDSLRWRIVTSFNLVQTGLWFRCNAPGYWFAELGSKNYALNFVELLHHYAVEIYRQ